MPDQLDPNLDQRLRAHLHRVTNTPIPSGFEARLSNVPDGRRSLGRYGWPAGIVLAPPVLVTVALASGLWLWTTHHGRSDSRSAGLVAEGTGTTDGVMDLRITISFRDQVTAISVRTGDPVRRGQALVSFDPQPFKQQLPALQTILSELQSQVQNTQTRMPSGGQNRVGELPSAIANRVASLQAQVTITQQLIDIAQGHTNELVSPIDGVVGRVATAAGNFTSPGQDLVQVLDTTNIIVTGTIGLAGEVPVPIGASADLAVVDMSGLTLHGRVIAAQPPTRNNSGPGYTEQVTVDAPNTWDRAVGAGMRTRVSVSLR